MNFLEEKMPTDLNTIFSRNISLINLADEVIFYLRSQNYDRALRTAYRLINILSNQIEMILINTDYFNKKYVVVDHDETLSIVANLCKAQESRDYILLADLYELQLIPLLISIQEIIISNGDILMKDTLDNQSINLISEADSVLGSKLASIQNVSHLRQQGYYVEFTSCGRMTLAIDMKDGKHYLHSNNRVGYEAFTLANSWYSIDKTKYIIYGLGLGYHISELLTIDSNIQLEIYESDINIIYLACLYADGIRIITDSRIKLIYDPDFSKLAKRMAMVDSDMNIHYPSLKTIKNQLLQEKLEDYFIQQSSIKNQLSLLNSNFSSNINNYDRIIDELKTRFQGKSLYIVAAGPSLDKNYMQLMNANDNDIILATGTVFRKLMKSGITPDYFIVLDANERVYQQVKGYEESNVPMLFLSTAYKGFALNYSGKKYIICQKDYFRAEELALKNNLMLFNTGGSVSTIALDIGIQFGCKRIIFLGLDLAYTDNYVHASDTSSRELSNTNDLRQVEDINGKLVYTSRNLDMYRKWIEKRIDGVKGIEFIDATEGGAKIKGMKAMKLSDCIFSDIN